MALTINPAIELDFKIRIRDRQRGFRELKLERDFDIRMLTHLLTLLDADSGTAQISAEAAKTLREQGFLIEESEVPSEVHFTSDEYEEDRLPAESAEPVVLLPGLTEMKDQGAWPWSNEGTNYFRGTIPGSGVSRVIAAEGDAAVALRSLSKGAPLHDLPSHLHAALAAKGAVLAQSRSVAAEEGWKERLDGCRVRLVEDSFCIIPQLLERKDCRVLTAHYGRMLEEGYFRASDDQCRTRNTVYNDPVASLLHASLAPLISKITQQKLRFSFCFVCRYRPGATLERHIDRAQCAWNISLLLHRSRDTDWPLMIEVGEAVHRGDLNIGDAVLYSGTEHPHWRDAQPADMESLICTYHFVDSEFTASID